MKKKDLIETSLVLLGLWSLYKGITSLFYLIYFYLVDFFSSVQAFELDFLYGSISDSLSFGVLAFLCFAQRPFLIKQMDIAISEEQINRVSNKTDLLEIGIIILCLAIFFTALPNFLFAIFTSFKSKVATGEKYQYNITLPFLKILIPFVVIIVREQIIKLLNRKNKQTPNV